MNILPAEFHATMKNPIVIISICIASLVPSQRTYSQPTQPEQQKESAHWWNYGHRENSYKSPDAKKLPLISVQGNRFVDPQGKTVLFRGVAISDPDKLQSQGHWNKTLLMKVKEMGAMIVRVPVHPAAWRERSPRKYLELLDQAVEWCTELGMYIIIDWHSIGNLKTELFQDPMYNTTMTETYEFWRAIAQRYAGNNTIAFYEIFNEPAQINNRLGRMSWDEWKKINEDIIVMIRAYDKETIPLVAPFDWAYDLTPLHTEPVEAEGIGYVTHPYPQKRSKPWEVKWEEDFGFAANRWPVFATEMGFTPGYRGRTDYDDYGESIVNYLENRGISWTVWVFDPEWGPALISSWETFQLTKGGEIFKKAMQDTTRRQH